MQWSEFKFARAQRVVIDASGTQGLVTARKEFLGEENQYEVRFLADDLSIVMFLIGEAELLSWQPAEPRRIDRITPAKKRSVLPKKRRR